MPVLNRISDEHLIVAFDRFTRGALERLGGEAPTSEQKLMLEMAKITMNVTRIPELRAIMVGNIRRFDALVPNSSMTPEDAMHMSLKPGGMLIRQMLEEQPELAQICGYDAEADTDKDLPYNRIVAQGFRAMGPVAMSHFVEEFRTRYPHVVRSDYNAAIDNLRNNAGQDVAKMFGELSTHLPEDLGSMTVQDFTREALDLLENPATRPLIELPLMLLAAIAMQQMHEKGIAIEQRLGLLPLPREAAAGPAMAMSR